MITQEIRQKLADIQLAACGILIIGAGWSSPSGHLFCAPMPSVKKRGDIRTVAPILRMMGHFLHQTVPFYFPFIGFFNPTRPLLASEVKRAHRTQSSHPTVGYLHPFRRPTPGRNQQMPWAPPGQCPARLSRRIQPFTADPHFRITGFITRPADGRVVPTKVAVISSLLVRCNWKCLAAMANV